MHATVCLLRAGQPRRAGAAAKSGQFVGQFSWVTGDPIVFKGLKIRISFTVNVVTINNDCFYYFCFNRNWHIWDFEKCAEIVQV